MSTINVEAIVDELVKAQPKLRDEPQAYARALLRKGVERGIVEMGIVVADRLIEQYEPTRPLKTEEG